MIHKTKYSYILLILILIINACSKDQAPFETLTDSKDGASVYIVKGTDNQSNLTIFPFVDEARKANFTVSFGAVGLPKNDIPVQLSIDNKVLDSVNLVRQNSGLAPYLAFPTDAYTVSNLNTVIGSGQQNSLPVEISYFSKKFDRTKSYMLPISIANAGGYKIGKNKTIFIIASKVQEVKATTTGWIATANSEQPAGENTGKASALIDGDLNTIWHAQYSPSPAGVYPYLINFDMLNPIYVTRLSIAPRQNNGNGPTLFKAEGSLDGSTWTTLMDNQVFDPNKRDGTYQDYPLSTPTNLRYIKVTLLQGKQTLSFLSEISVYRY